MPRNASTHAAGVVITDQPVCKYVPLAKDNDAVVSQFTMTTLEELGLLKMDFWDCAIYLLFKMRNYRLETKSRIFRLKRSLWTIKKHLQ